MPRKKNKMRKQTKIKPIKSVFKNNLIESVFNKKPDKMANINKVGENFKLPPI